MKRSILFIHEDKPNQHLLFREIEDGQTPNVDVSKYGAEWRELTPTFHARGYTFRVRSKGKTHQGRITTRGILVVRTYRR